MALLEIVSILQVLFAGIAFALAFLAYRLVRSIADQPTVDPEKVQLSNKFMIFAFAIGALAIVAQFFNNLNTRTEAELDSALKRATGQINTQASQIADNTDNLRYLRAQTGTMMSDFSLL